MPSGGCPTGRRHGRGLGGEEVVDVVEGEGGEPLGVGLEWGETTKGKQGQGYAEQGNGPRPAASVHELRAE